VTARPKGSIDVARHTGGQTAIDGVEGDKLDNLGC